MKIWPYFFLFLGFLFYLLPAEAGNLTQETCPSVEPIDLGPIRNQSSADWCWAFTAADLIGFFQGVAPKNQLSPVDIVLATYDAGRDALRSLPQEGSSFTAYDFLNADIEFLRKNRARFRGQLLQARDMWGFLAVDAYNSRQRLCLEAALPSEAPRGQNQKHQKDPNDVFRDPADRQYVTFLTDRLKDWGDTTQTDRSRENPLVDLVVNGAASPNLTHPKRSAVEEANVKTLRQIDQRAQIVCQNGPARMPMRSRVEFFDDYWTALSKGEETVRAPAEAVAEGLLRGAPIAISYDADYLLNKNWKPSPEPIPSHESSIVGMRWNGGRCEFRLRNSWGVGNSGLSPAVADRVENGYLWLREDELNRLVYATYYIEKPAPGIIQRATASRPHPTNKPGSK